jgi:RIO-like serine/threonine protein kinase
MGCAQSLLKLDADLETLYSLDKCIGEGVEGMVYLATCKASSAKVAIKLVPRWVQQHNRASRQEYLSPCVVYRPRLKTVMWQ